MIKISRTEADLLREKGLDQYIHVKNKTHKSNHKTYYVIETRPALECLGFDIDKNRKFMKYF